MSAAISALRPDFEIAYICGDLPHWFSLLLGKCEVGAMSEVNTDIHYHNVAFQNTEGEEDRALVYHEAYMPAFAETFPKLLAKALAKHEAEKDQPHRVRDDARAAARAKVVSAAISTLRPDLKTAYICGDPPYWFSRMLASCEFRATCTITSALCHNNLVRRSAEDKEGRALVYDAASAFAKTFPKLLAKALAEHDAINNQPQPAA